MSTSNMFIQGSYSTQRETDAVMYVVPDRDIVFPQQVTIFMRIPYIIWNIEILV